MTGGWSSLDFIRQLPEWISVRVAHSSDDPYIVFFNAQHEVYVTLSLDSVDQWKIAQHSLGKIVFEKEYPGRFGPLIERWALAAGAGVDLPPEDKAMMRRFGELTGVVVER